MSEGAMAPCPSDSDLMKAWNAYQETDDFKDSLYWASTDTVMRQERAQELGVQPDANVANSIQKEEHVKGALWAAFLRGFEAAGGQVRF